MYKKIKLSASLMCADWLNLKSQILDLEQNDIDYMHYDVVDGVYAPDFTMGTTIIDTVREFTKLPGHYHLMVEEPMRLFQNFNLTKSEIFTIHQETSKNLHRDLIDINLDLDLTEKPLQHNNLNANFSENNASNSGEEIFVEIDSFFLDSAKSLLAQNFTDDNYIENEVSKADTKEKKQTKPDDEVRSDNNKSPESPEIQQTIEPVSASVPVEMVVSSNGLVYGVAFLWPQ